MSTEAQQFEQSLADLDVETSRVPPSDVPEAIEEFALEPAVAVPFEGERWTWPPSVEVDPTPATLREARTGVTRAAFAVADYGSLALHSTGTGSELVSLFVDRHVAVVDRSDLLPDMDAAFDRFGADIDEEYGSAIVATGPSATADMGALVKGAHGPSEVRVVIVED